MDKQMDSAFQQAPVLNLTEECERIIFEKMDTPRSGIVLDVSREGREILKGRLSQFLASLSPVLEAGVTSEDVARALERTFNGDIAGNEGMLKFFTQFNGANANLGPEDAKVAADRLGLKTIE